MKSLWLGLGALALAGCGLFMDDDDDDDVQVTVRDEDDDLDVDVQDRDRDDERLEFENRRDVWRTQPEHLYPPYIVPYAPPREDLYTGRVEGYVEDDDDDRFLDDEDDVDIERDTEMDRHPDRDTELEGELDLDEDRDIERKEGKVQDEELEKFLSGWPAKSQEAARAMIAKYGPPDGRTESHLHWSDKAPFKEIIVYKEEVRHSWPKEHTDVLEHVIEYKVPADKFDELAAFDGSVIAERTKGTLAARCDREEANLLALNLAVDIITDKRSVEDARRFYEQTMMQMSGAEKNEYTTKLRFEVPSGDTGDPDQPADMKRDERKEDGQEQKYEQDKRED